MRFVLIAAALAFAFACGAEGSQEGAQEGSDPVTRRETEAFLTDNPEGDARNRNDDEIDDQTTSEARESAQDFLLSLIEMQMEKGWEPTYDHLHPAQKKLINRAELSECGEGFAVSPAVKYEVVEVYDDRCEIPGTRRVESSKAVRLNVYLELDESVRGKPMKTLIGTQTYHAFLVSGEWKWAVSLGTIQDITKEFS